MKRSVIATTSCVFALACQAAFAGSHLTPDQCNDYPFTPLHGEVTHKQLMKELGELEAVGYQPDEDQNYYPQDLQDAEAKLRQEYRRDCVAPPVSGAAVSPSPDVRAQSQQ